MCASAAMGPGIQVPCPACLRKSLTVEDAMSFFPPCDLDNATKEQKKKTEEKKNLDKTRLSITTIEYRV